MQKTTPPDLTRFKQAALFQGLDEKALDHIFRAAQIKLLAPDEILFMQEDPAKYFYVVVEGKLKLTQVTVDGHQVILSYITAGQALAVMAAISLPGYPATAQAVEASRLLAWDREGIRKLMLDHPLLALNSMQVLAEHVVEYQTRLRELATERVERRIARTLLRLARQTGRKTDEGVRIDMPITRQDLAELTGTTLFTVSRTLSNWESQGLVHSGREQITIRKPHGLVTIAEDLG